MTDIINISLLFSQQLVATWLLTCTFCGVFLADNLFFMEVAKWRSIVSSLFNSPTHILEIGRSHYGSLGSWYGCSSRTDRLIAKLIIWSVNTGAIPASVLYFVVT